MSVEKIFSWKDLNVIWMCFSVIFHIPQTIYDIVYLFFYITLNFWRTTFICLSIICLFFFVCLSLFICSSVRLSICLSVGIYTTIKIDRTLRTTELHLWIVKWFIPLKENQKFDLTTFGFNDQKSPVPSGSLNRVPTILKCLSCSMWCLVLWLILKVDRFEFWS